MYFEGELPTVVNGGGYNNGGMWGSDGIWAILLLALLGGRGFGGFGGGYGGGSEFVGYELGKTATQADVANGFAQNTLQRGIDDILLSNTQGFAGLNTVISNATSTTNYNMLQGFNGLSSQLAQCCCDLKQMNLENRYLNEKQTCDLITNQNANTQRIIDYMQCEKIDTLNRKLAVAEGQISQYAQTNAIVAALKPQPVPSYSVPNPNCCYNNFGCGGTTL